MFANKPSNYKLSTSKHSSPSNTKNNNQNQKSNLAIEKYSIELLATNPTALGGMLSSIDDMDDEWMNLS